MGRVMRVLVRFYVEAPDAVRLEVLAVAGRQAACAFENAVEREEERACVAGPVRILVTTNKSGEEQ